MRWMELSGTVLPAVKRGELWEVDFEPQTHKEEPGKRGRPALVLQSDILNNAGHATTIVIPGTTQVYQDAHGDAFPLRVRIAKFATLREDTDLLVDQIRTVSNRRFMGSAPIAVLAPNHLKRVLEALRLLTA